MSAHPVSLTALIVTPTLARLRRFTRDENGSQSVEFVLVFPLIVFALLAIFDWAQAFRIRAMAFEATAVVGDTLSRQTTPINQASLDGLRAVAGMVSGYGANTAIRVTQVFCESKCDDLSGRVLRMVFSRGAGMTALAEVDFAGGATRSLVPLAAEGDRIILAQARLPYDPVFGTEAKPEEVITTQITRMRFAPRLCWETCDPTS